MNSPLRRVGVVVLLLFAMLFINLNWVQAYKAESYRTSKYNGRVLLDAYQHQRGEILDDKGNVLAKSVPTKDNLKYQRVYPSGQAFQPILGYRPVTLGATGIEAAENAFLSGATGTDQLTDLFFENESAGGNVTLTLNKDVQQVAYNDLAHNGGASVGAAVALDPQTGRILAMASTPGFDPAPLASHSTSTAQTAYNKLESQTISPLLNRAISDTYPPGSTFKVIMSAAALSTGQYTPDTVVPAGPSYTPIAGGGYTMKNDAPSVCPQAQITLIEALTVSCNTAYAQLGVALGADDLKAEARAFGFEDNSLSIAGDNDSNVNVVASHTGDMLAPNGQVDLNYLAQSSIGQYQVRMTPLQGAMIAAAVANNGVQMKPYLISKTQTADLKTTYVGQSQTLRTPITPAVAAQLQTMMYSVVQNGTGKSAQISGYQVGGKTGTAQAAVGSEDHRWFIGFTIKDGKPIAAVAVLLVNGGHLGTLSAPKIGGDIMKAVIAAEGGQ